MDKITLTFTGSFCVMMVLDSPTIILTLSDEGKQTFVKNAYGIQSVDAPKRVINAFNYSAIQKILDKDELPSNSDYEALDGYIYNISITVGNFVKEYSADDNSVQTYPLLRYIASWFRKL